MANAVTKVYYAVLVGDLAEEQDCKLPRGPAQVKHNQLSDFA